MPWNGLSYMFFCHVSEKGYGANVYIRVPKGSDIFEVCLVISRARVAPLKRVSVPRLELLGALLGARPFKFVYKTLKLENKVSFWCWTDSTIVLSWIKGIPCKWKPFVANRVSDIQELTAPSCWYQCPSEHNPADLSTRGKLAEDLITSNLWLAFRTFCCGRK